MFLFRQKWQRTDVKFVSYLSINKAPSKQAILRWLRSAIAFFFSSLRLLWRVFFSLRLLWRVIFVFRHVLTHRLQRWLRKQWKRYCFYFSVVGLAKAWTVTLRLSGNYKNLWKGKYGGIAASVVTKTNEYKANKCKMQNISFLTLSVSLSVCGLCLCLSLLSQRR